MSKWIETDDGNFVNLDHVQRIETIDDEDDLNPRRHYYELHLDNREIARIALDNNVPLAELLAPIVPAEPGQRAVQLEPDTVGDDAARPETVEVYRYQVLGWRVGITPLGEPLPPVPILPVPLSELEGMVLVELPDGRLLETGGLEGLEFDHMDDAKQHALEQAQAKWDHRHNPKTVDE
jgi:hypothetical protein